jgi:glycosyltransferase involved in cell wall biosynthesis
VKKVLIIVYYWPPSGGGGVQRWVKFVKYLRNYGWEPIVYTVKDAEFPVIDLSLEKEIPIGVEIIRRPIFEPFKWYKKFLGLNSNEKVQVGVIEELSKGSWKQKMALWMRSNLFIPDARMFWIRPSVQYLSQYLKTNQVDLIVTSGPPHSAHLIGRGLKKKLNIKWLADFRDPWTGIYYFKDLNLTNLARYIHRKLEKSVLMNADHVTVVGKGMQKNFSEIRKDVSVVTNGYDDDDFKIKYEKYEKYTIAHTGTFIYELCPPSFWHCLAELVQTKEILDLEIKLIGKTDQRIIDNMPIILRPYLEFTPYLPHSQINEIQQRSHLLLLFLEITTPVLSGKFFEYIGSNTPILVTGNPKANFEVHDIVTKDVKNAFFTQDDKIEMKKFILNNYQNRHLEHTKNDEHLQFSRNVLTKKISDIFNSILSNPS